MFLLGCTMLRYRHANSTTNKKGEMGVGKGRRREKKPNHIWVRGGGVRDDLFFQFELFLLLITNEACNNLFL